MRVDLGDQVRGPPRAAGGPKATEAQLRERIQELQAQVSKFMLERKKFIDHITDLTIQLGARHV